LGPVSRALRAVSSIEILTIPSQAPRAKAICERFLLSARRECLNHLLILHEKQVHRVLHASAEYFNRARPHQGIQQQVPQAAISCVPLGRRNELVFAAPILGGLHQD
jgi:putative transposase